MRKMLNCIWAIAVFLMASCESKDKPQYAILASDTDPNVETLLQIEKDRLAAINEQKDTNAIKKSLHPDYILVDAFGKYNNRTTTLRQFFVTFSSSIQERHTTKNIKVRLLEKNTALLEGIYSVQINDTKGMTVLNMRFSNIYIRQEKQWLLLYAHLTRVRD